MKIFNKHVWASVLVLGTFAFASCGDSEEDAPIIDLPTITVVGDNAKQALIEEGSALQFKVSVDAPEGFKSLEITSDLDPDFSQTVSSDTDTFEADLGIDVSQKAPGTEVFTFTVTDNLDQTAEVSVTARYRLEAIAYNAVLLGNAYDPDPDIVGHVSDNEAYFSLTTGEKFVGQKIADENLDETNDIHFLYYQDNDSVLSLLPTASETADGLIDQLDWEGERFDLTYRQIEKSDFDDVTAAQGLDLVLLLDSLFENADAEAVVTFTDTTYLVYRIEATGETGVIRTVFKENGEDIEDNELILEIYANRNQE